MLIFVEENQRDTYKDQLNQYFKLRKKVFHDQLQWDVKIHGDQEIDVLDESPCTYTLYVSENGQVMGGARLIPTTQTTLLDYAFDGLVPEDISFTSPAIWECSRYCVDHELENTRLSSGAKRATLGLSVGNFDYAVRNGIEFYIAVIEARMFQFSHNYGSNADVLARKTIDNCDVVCALYPITPEVGKTVDKLRLLTGDKTYSG